MPLTKKAAFKALAQKARKKYGFQFDGTSLINESQVREFQKSTESSYRLFAEIYEAKEYKHGGHPDYDYLAESENIGKTESGNITTLFMDLKNFTKYCCFIPPSDVYKAKATVIETVIDICKCYDGHLHEIPGDGVMFFFGGKGKDDLDTSTQAINAAINAMSVLEEEVIPEYNNSEKYPDIYPKMGIDYGNVVWGAYGADPYYEVKATSFYVDIASKMMSRCNAKEIATGSGLREYLKLEDEYVDKAKPYERKLTINGETKSIKYDIWLFDWRKYLKNRENSDSDIAQLLYPVDTVGSDEILSSGSKTKLGSAPLA